MRHAQTPSLPLTPRAVADAMALVASPDIAARLPLSIRRLAWQIVASQAGSPAIQLRRDARTGGREAGAVQ